MTLKRAIIIVTSAVAIGAGLGALSAYLVPPAHADEPAIEYACGTMDDAANMAATLGGTPFTILTRDQWEFVRAVFAMLPDTPPGLPPGDQAALSLRPNGSGSVVFLDEGRACSPIKLDRTGVAHLLQVGSGELVHSRAGL